MKRFVIGCVLLVFLLAGCGKQKKTDPKTPEEMYARVQELLQPHVEGDASDIEGALRWLRRAAEAGLVQAQTDLGGIYLEGGKGVKRDGQAAFAWFSRAAEQGSLEAEFYLGLILFKGVDMAQDKAAALRHWRKAADAGIAEAQYRLGGVLSGAADTAAEGMELLNKAAQSHVPATAAQAACALGNIYATGKAGVKANMAEAAHWYGRGADGGDARAQLAYAVMLIRGVGVEKDAPLGMRYLRLAAGQDYPDAIALLVNLLRNGENAGSCEDEAQAWSERLERLRTGNDSEE